MKKKISVWQNRGVSITILWISKFFVEAKIGKNMILSKEKGCGVQLALKN